VTEDRTWMQGTGERPPSADLHPEVAHPARVYDVWLGGKDNFASDRAVAEQLAALTPDVVNAARANRAFLGRAVRTVSALGVSQFLDIGTGIPAAGNTHQVAQQADPSARVAYVDNDPIVLTHARALMSGSGHGATTVTQADLRDPEAILAAPGVRDLLDFSRPIALMLVAVLHFIGDDQDPQGIVKRLLEALPTGSHLILTHGTGDTLPQELAQRAEQSYDRAAAHLHLRPQQEVQRFFGGGELLEPGLVLAPYWRPDGPLPEDAARLGIYAGIARY
jgi:hypothetical protein